MNSPAKLAEQQRQFLEETARGYGFTGDTETAFRGRFDPNNTKKINKVLAGYLAWNKEPADKAQKLQDELDKICEVLEQDGCLIERLSTDERKRGRSPKGKSPWEQVLKWLWQSKFPEWQQSQTINADDLETNSIEERIFRATEQLNSRGFSTVVGIQALEEIAKDSSRYHWKIMELLAAFVRKNASRKEEEERKEERSPKLAGDIQAALTVIGQRDPEKDKGVLDLSSTDLRGANLREAELQGINLSAAQLQGADFCEAKLQGAYLIKANLKEAQLVMANLEGAYIHQANLEEVKFLEAILRRTKLPEANLKEADFCNADLGFADLRKTNLECAKFDGAKLTGAQLSQANLRETYLIGADLKGTNFSETDVELKQIEYAFGDSTTVLPNNVERPAHWM